MDEENKGQDTEKDPGEAGEEKTAEGEGTEKDAPPAEGEQKEGESSGEKPGDAENTSQ